MLDAGFSIYILLIHLLDYQEQVRATEEPVVDEKRVTEMLSPKAEAHYARYTAGVEIVNAVGELERVHFRFPAFCLWLSEERKQKLLWEASRDHAPTPRTVPPYKPRHGPRPHAPTLTRRRPIWQVDRDTPGSQVFEFFQAAADMHAEMTHQQQLSEMWIWRSVMRCAPHAPRPAPCTLHLRRRTGGPIERRRAPPSALARYKSVAVNSLFSLALLNNLLLMFRSNLCLNQAGEPYVWSDRFCSILVYNDVLPAELSEDRRRRLSEVTDRFEGTGRWLSEGGSGVAEEGEGACEPLWQAPSYPNYCHTELPSHTSYFGVDGVALSPWPEVGAALEYVIFVVGILMVFSAVVTFTIYAMQSGPLRVKHRFKEVTGLPTYEAVVDKARASKLFALRFGLSWPLYLLLDLKLLYLLFSFVAAIAALAASPYLCAAPRHVRHAHLCDSTPDTPAPSDVGRHCFHLFDIASRSQDLQNVWKAVSQNGRSIAWTVAFTIIVIYAFAVVGYLELADMFGTGDHPDNELPVCTSLWMCFLTAINEGLRGGDIGGYMGSKYNPDIVELDGKDTALFYLQVFFQLAFWFIVITILLNVIFGIIIDSFGELRNNNLAIKHAMENSCFISGIDRFTLDTKGGGFVNHIKKHQNMWNYLYLIITLREKDETDYNGWESHVAQMMEKEDMSFFPRNDAIALKDLKEREESEARAHMDRVSATADHVVEITRVVNTLQEKVGEMERKQEEAARQQSDTLAAVLAAMSASVPAAPSIDAALSDRMRRL